MFKLVKHGVLFALRESILMILIHIHGCWLCSSYDALPAELQWSVDSDWSGEICKSFKWYFWIYGVYENQTMIVINSTPCQLVSNWVSRGAWAIPKCYSDWGVHTTSRAPDRRCNKSLDTVIETETSETTSPLLCLSKNTIMQIAKKKIILRGTTTISRLFQLLLT